MALSVALAALRDAARHPAALAFFALVLLGAQLLLRVAFAHTAPAWLGLLLGADLPLRAAATLGLALVCVAALQAAALCGALGALACERDTASSEALGVLDGLAALPSALTAQLTGWLVCAAVTFFEVVAFGAIGAVAVPALRALAFALVFAPGMLAITWATLSALLASAWLAGGELPARRLSDGVVAFSRAGLALVEDPSRSAATLSALGLCTIPLLLLVALTSLAWSARPLPAAVALHLAQTLAAGAWLAVTARGLSIAFPAADHGGSSDPKAW